MSAGHDGPDGHPDDSKSDCAPSLLDAAGLDAAGLGSAVVGSADARVADALSRLASVIEELAGCDVSQL
ncbi:hypothetical protein, partial [Gordonia otitidis]|uniref:hypothetical protein n=1 Tax=Gordonia otitidis TaxID=249058 RepID=UPI0023555F5E